MVASSKRIRVPKIGGESLAPAAPALKLIAAKTRRGRRILDARAPKAVSLGGICELHVFFASLSQQPST
jgi:hypothetical protein